MCATKTQKGGTLIEGRSLTEHMIIKLSITEGKRKRVLYGIIRERRVIEPSCRRGELGGVVCSGDRQGRENGDLSCGLVGFEFGWWEGSGSSGVV